MAQNDQMPAVHHWRGHIDLQMHFNSMLMQLRAIGMSVVVAVFGAAALTLARSPDRMTVVPGGEIHVAALTCSSIRHSSAISRRLR